MIEGSTVIMSQEFIDELIRHRDICKKKLEHEFSIPARNELQKKYDHLEKSISNALDFQDTIVEIINVDIPRITAVRTATGLVLPIKNVKIL